VRVHRSIPLTLLIAATTVSLAQASETVMGGGYTIATFPVGDWGEVAGFGLGIDGGTMVRKASNKAISVRSNLGLLYNFSRTQDVPSENLDPGSALKLETKNFSLFFGLGPEFSRPGEGVTPFVFGTVGFQTFWSSSNLSGTAGGLPYDSEFGDSRIAFAWTGGVGLRRNLGSQLTELSVEYRAGGEHKYVLPSEVTNNGAAVSADRKLRSSDQILVRFGTVIGASSATSE